MPTALIPDNKVRRWVQAGLGNKEIVERLRREDHIEVTSAAISVFRSRHNLQADHTKIRYEELLPWTVKREHNSLYIAKMLRAEARRRAGGKLEGLALKRLENFLRRLEEENAVVHYEPATAEGFWLVTRREGVDTDIIRVPD
jgi:hypothetical protein